MDAVDFCRQRRTHLPQLVLVGASPAQILQYASVADAFELRALLENRDEPSAIRAEYEPANVGVADYNAVEATFGACDMREYGYQRLLVVDSKRISSSSARS